MTLDDFVESAQTDAEPPPGISPELRAMWFCKRDEWEKSHNIAQDIPSSMGSRIHGLLHTIEGDLGNAGYWYSRAGCAAISPSQIDEEWQSIVEELIGTKENSA